MTDKKMEELLHAPLSNEDEQLLQSFFADCQTEIPDDGFTDRVMEALPSAEVEKNAVMCRRMERVWTLVCVAIGVVAVIVCQGWEQLQGFANSLRIDFMSSVSRVLAQLLDVLGQTHNLWMCLAGIVVLVMVWGYNEVQDAR